MADAISIEDILLTLEEHRFNLGAAARDLGIRRNALKERIERTPQLAAALEDFREGLKDKAEDNVNIAVLNGDKGASQFVLQTIGKDRGYHTGVAGVGKDGEIVIQIQRFTDSPAEEVPALSHSGAD